MEQTLEPRAEYARAVSAASWPAIIAGAFVAASVSLVLFALGSGLGFASISPWPGRGVSATTFAVTAAIWLIVMQWVSSALGGYITGRLRTRWVGTHAHEVFFRDTAHGLVTWAVATVLVAATFATSLFSVIGGGAHAAAGAVSAGVQGAMAGGFSPGTGGPAPGGNGPGAGGPAPGGPSGVDPYGLDKLFRSAAPGTAGPGMAGPGMAGPGMAGPGPAGQGAGDPRGAGDSRVEAAHIVANAWSTGAVPDADRSYLAELVAARTGLSPADAQKRVDDFVTAALDAETKIKANADAARKAAAQAAIYTALSMLVGAFIASVSAALGGRLRDEHL